VSSVRPVVPFLPLCVEPAAQVPPTQNASQPLGVLRANCRCLATPGTLPREPLATVVAGDGTRKCGLLRGLQELDSIAKRIASFKTLARVANMRQLELDTRQDFIGLLKVRLLGWQYSKDSRPLLSFFFDEKCQGQMR
jgi:hypothetical protein